LSIVPGATSLKDLPKKREKINRPEGLSHQKITYAAVFFLRERRILEARSGTFLILFKRHGKPEREDRGRIGINLQKEKI